MKRNSCILIGVAAMLLSAQALAQITFYEGEGFRGRAFTAGRTIADFTRTGFNDRASSVVVDGGRWEVCEDSAFRGHCVLLRPGAYDSLRRLGVNDRLSSARKVSGDRDYASGGRDYGNGGRDYGSGGRDYGNAAPEPLAEANYDYRRRPNERVYEAPVTSVHAVVGPPDRRCWVEREQIDQRRRGDPNVAGGVIGAVIGGIIGHQIGSGRGNDAATVGGAVVGAAIGANQGRGGGDRVTDVRRCETVAEANPDYWDVTYRFRNVDHRVQMTAPPGRVIYVNRDGEPRQ